MIPKTKKVAKFLLMELANREGGKAFPNEMYESLKKHFQLSPNNLVNPTTEDPPRSRWENRVRNAVSYLRKAAFLYRGDGTHGVWEITDLDRKQVESNVEF
jgi:hypothetical protein